MMRSVPIQRMTGEQTGVHPESRQFKEAGVSGAGELPGWTADLEVSSGNLLLRRLKEAGDGKEDLVSGIYDVSDIIASLRSLKSFHFTHFRRKVYEGFFLFLSMKY